MTQVRSSRGELVDFDTLRIKQQLNLSPSTTEVLAREEHVQERLNRRAIRRAQQIAKAAAAKQQDSAPIVEQAEEVSPNSDPLLDEIDSLDEQVDEPIVRKQVRTKIKDTE